MRIIGEIPARLGSQRVKQKNLRPINGKPLISYTIEAAKKSELLTEVYVNTESDKLGAIAKKYGVKYYKRDERLSSDTATSDEFNYDFINGTGADVLVMINPVSPLIDSTDIDKIITFFLNNKYDSVISIREEYFQALMDNEPVNFDINKMLPRTQDLSPIQLCSWAVCVWRATTFIESFKKNGHAVFSGNVGYYTLDKIKAIKISTEEDFFIAEQFLKAREQNLSSGRNDENVNA